MDNKLEKNVREQFPEFVEEVVGLSVEQLNNRLSQFAKDLEAVSESLQQDDELKQAKDLVKQLNAPYIDAKKALKLKTKYVIKLIKEKGGE